LSSADAPPTEEAAEAPPTPGPDATDERRSPVIDALRGRIGDGLVTQHVAPGVDAWVRVTRDAWGDAAVALEALGFTFFDFLSAIDWYPNVHGKNEEPPSSPLVVPATSAELEHGTTGGETRFQLLARVFSPERKIGLHLKADLPDDDLRAPTWSNTYPGADWHEREMYEMYGITFDGHPNLQNIYLPTGFQGNPLRKDFPLLARHVKPWPGLVDVEAMPGEPDEDEAATDATEGEE
jgi:NADH-quinone oxidoreductase subunit C